MKKCVYCDKAIKPRKRFSIGWFLVFCLTGIGGLIYILYYALLKRAECPICGGDRFVNVELTA